MRTLLKVTIPVEAGNRAIKNGTLSRLMEGVTARLKPEAAYFYADHGARTMFFVFNMTDASQVPAIVEPLFQGLDAAVLLTPVMNLDDLKKGLAEAGSV